MSNQSRRRRARERAARRNRTLAAAAIVVIVALVVVLGIAARGNDSTEGPQLSDVGREGKALAVTRSCSGCHGRNGEGGAGGSGPAWIGLFGSTVTLQDGTSVIADVDYLTESIVNPNARLVKGFGRMPQDNISASDTAALVQYIEELATETTAAALHD
jgi:cytochrome c oxidase subunit 2